MHDDYVVAFTASAVSDGLCGHKITLPTFLRSCIRAIADANYKHRSTREDMVVIARH